MGTFTEKITLLNARDIGNARDGLIPHTKIRAVILDTDY